MGVYAIKPKFQRLLKPVADFFIDRKIHPDTINLFGTMSSFLIGFSIFFSKDMIILYLVLPLGALIRTSFNALDGMVARGLSVSSAFGEVKNELHDRVSDIIIFTALGLSGHGNLKIVFISLSLILLNSYIGILGKSAGGSRIYAGILGKADRMILLGIGGFLSFMKIGSWNIVYIIIIIGTIVSICQRFLLIRKELDYEYSK